MVTTTGPLKAGNRVTVQVGGTVENGIVWSSAPGGRYWVHVGTAKRPTLCRRKRDSNHLQPVQEG